MHHVAVSGVTNMHGYSCKIGAYLYTVFDLISEQSA